jgi:tetratricopeptide (TPR) repeat protein
MTQAQLAEGRYTKAYVSALENGLVKPSMAALNFLGNRLGVPIARLLATEEPAWTRLEADLRLASGDWQAAADAFAALLELDPGPLARPELQVGLAEALCRLDRGEEAVRAASAAASEFRAQGRHADAALATYWESFGLYELEQSDEAKHLLQRTLDEIAAGLTVEPDLPVRVLIALAMNEARDDEPERALAHLERARGLVDELDSRRRATFLFSLALSYRELGDLEGAITTGTQSLAHFRAASADFEVASLENELALVQLALGNIERARAHAASARSGFERLENERWLAHVAETEAQIELAAGNLDLATERGNEALQRAETVGNHKAAVSALLTLARTKRAAGDLRGGADALERAAATARELGRRGQLQAVLAEWADVMAELGDLAAAYRLSREALAAGRS